jgi:eukaryotic-like serine/threonine-protein kinase
VVAVAEVLSERYEFLSRIAAGGMGEVWRGRDLRLQRDVAIKVLRAEHADDPDFRTRLHAEARAAGAINCDSVVDVYDYGEQTDDAGRFLSYVVMELVEGDTVAQLIARDGAVGAERTARILTDTAAGLAAAHRRGLVHRDIKPANLLMTDEGRVKIADFGIARAANGMAITRAGTMVGTATYVAPEQVQGRPATSASDIYSLGIVAYECLSGTPPFRGDGEIATALARVNVAAPALPPSVPHWLAALVLAMLDPDPDARPSAGDVARRTAVVPLDRPTQVSEVPVQPVPTMALPVPLPLFVAPPASVPAAMPSAAPAAETTDLVVPESRRAQLGGYVRSQPAVMVAVLGLLVLAVVVPSFSAASPGIPRSMASEIAAAQRARPAASTPAPVPAPVAATDQGQPAAATTSVHKTTPVKPKPKPRHHVAKPRHNGQGRGGPGPGHGHGHSHGSGDGRGHGGGDDD